MHQRPSKLNGTSLPLLILAVFPIAAGSVELVQYVILGEWSEDLLLVAFSLLCPLMPALAILHQARTKRGVCARALVPSSALRLRSMRMLFAAYIGLELVLRFGAAGSLDTFVADFFAARGAKSWQEDLSEINRASFDSLQYSGLLLACIACTYIAFAILGVVRSRIDNIILGVLLALTLSDFNRAQFMLACIAVIGGLKSKKSIVLASVAALALIVAQGTLRGNFLEVIESGIEVETQGLDGSYLGQPHLLSMTAPIGGVVQTDRIVEVAAAYYVPRFIWTSKPVPHESDWMGIKPLWVAAGLYVELALMFGVIPAFLAMATFYLFWTYVILSIKRPTLMNLSFVVSLLAVLIWTPRSFQAFIQFSPIILAVTGIAQLSRVRLGATNASLHEQYGR